jgi:quercetin dioxygenase-like cupin family protein
MVIGAASHLLETGDAFYFRADIIHRFENAGTGACVYLAVLDYAPRG